MDLTKVTRFEVIDGTGRLIVVHGVEVKADIQDEGRTLKIFLKDRESSPLPTINSLTAD